MIYDKPEHFMYNGLQIPIEFWKPVTEEMVPGIKPIYWISNIGNMYNSETGRYLSYNINPNDYVRVVVQFRDGSSRMTTIHRLVCMAFNGLPPGPDYHVDHINSNKSCSVENNLEWVTRQENARRAHDNNLCRVAEDHYKSILTNDEVREICEMLSQGIPINDISAFMTKKIYPRQYSSGINDIIYQILNRVIWKSISKDYTFHDYSRIHLSESELHAVCKGLEDGFGYDYIIDNILNMKDCDQHKRDRLKETFYNIKRGRFFTKISSKYNIHNTRKFTLTEDELNLVCEMVAKGCNNAEIISALGDRGNDEKVKTAIYDIQRGSCHKKLVYKYKEKLSEGSTTSP